jgi:hypothetical protein
VSIELTLFGAHQLLYFGILGAGAPGKAAGRLIGRLDSAHGSYSTEARMPKRRSSQWVWIAGGVGIACALVAGIIGLRLATTPARPPAPGADQVRHRATLNETSGPEELARGIEAGEGLALAMLQKRLMGIDPAPPTAVPIEESEAWQAILAAIRNGSAKYSAYGRATAVSLAARVVQRYGVDPAPTDWSACLMPFSEITAAAVADTDTGVRTAALQEIARLWNWAPGRDMFTGQVDHVAAWKMGLHGLVVGELEDPEAQVRAAAVAALAAIGVDDLARPAMARLDDESPDVRLQVLSGFARRRTLLDEEAILPFLYDAAPGLAAAAEQILKERGLTEAQLGLARLVVHPIEAMRLSAVAMVQQRTDIDSTLWLIFLSRDRSDAVRARAVEALAQSNRPEALTRLSEMAAADPSEDIRQAAARVAPVRDVETTAALPPLPGSPTLNPKAN